MRRLLAAGVALAKAAAAAAWTGLAVLGSMASFPFDRLAPLVVGLIMAPLMSLMWATLAGSMSSVKTAPEGRPAEAAGQARWDSWLEKTRSTAAALKMPLPKKLTVYGGDVVQAKAGGTPSDYELVVYGGLDRLPAEQQDAVLRHELGHVRHRDSLGTVAQMFLATIGPMLALMSGMISDERAWLTVPIILASIPLWYASKRMDEYHADQYAAHTMGSPAPLIRFFVADAEDREAALLAAEGRPAPLRSRGRRAWDAARSVVAGHPSHASRSGRLRSLADK